MPRTILFTLTLLAAGSAQLAAAATVLITGANSGIGLEFAKQYAALRRGHRTLVRYRA